MVSHSVPSTGRKRPRKVLPQRAHPADDATLTTLFDSIGSSGIPPKTIVKKAVSKSITSEGSWALRSKGESRIDGVPPCRASRKISSWLHRNLVNAKMGGEEHSNILAAQQGVLDNAMVQLTKAVAVYSKDLAEVVSVVFESAKELASTRASEADAEAAAAAYQEKLEKAQRETGGKCIDEVNLDDVASLKQLLNASELHVLKARLLCMVTMSRRREEEIKAEREQSLKTIETQAEALSRITQWFPNFELYASGAARHMLPETSEGDKLKPDLGTTPIAAVQADLRRLVAVFLDEGERRLNSSQSGMVVQSNKVDSNVGSHEVQERRRGYRATAGGGEELLDDVAMEGNGEKSDQKDQPWKDQSGAVASAVVTPTQVDAILRDCESSRQELSRARNRLLAQQTAERVRGKRDDLRIRLIGSDNNQLLTMLRTCIQQPVHQVQPARNLSEFLLGWKVRFGSVRRRKQSAMAAIVVHRQLVRLLRLKLSVDRMRLGAVHSWLHSGVLAQGLVPHEPFWAFVATYYFSRFAAKEAFTRVQELLDALKDLSAANGGSSRNIAQASHAAHSLHEHHRDFFRVTHTLLSGEAVLDYMHVGELRRPPEEVSSTFEHLFFDFFEQLQHCVHVDVAKANEKGPHGRKGVREILPVCRVPLAQCCAILRSIFNLSEADERPFEAEDPESAVSARLARVTVGPKLPHTVPFYIASDLICNYIKAHSAQCGGENADVFHVIRISCERVEHSRQAFQRVVQALLDEIQVDQDELNLREYTILVRTFDGNFPFGCARLEYLHVMQLVNSQSDSDQGLAEEICNMPHSMTGIQVAVEVEPGHPKDEASFSAYVLRFAQMVIENCSSASLEKLGIVIDSQIFHRRLQRLHALLFNASNVSFSQPLNESMDIFALAKLVESELGICLVANGVEWAYRSDEVASIVRRRRLRVAFTGWRDLKRADGLLDDTSDRWRKLRESTTL